MGYNIHWHSTQSVRDYIDLARVVKNTHVIIFDMFQLCALSEIKILTYWRLLWSVNTSTYTHKDNSSIFSRQLQWPQVQDHELDSFSLEPWVKYKCTLSPYHDSQLHNQKLLEECKNTLQTLKYPSINSTLKRR